MTPDDVAALMEDPVAQRLLASANPARLAYVARDGTPRVVPVGFDWTGTTIVIGTVPGSAKVHALQANPAVALTIDTSPPAWPPNALLIRGTATVTIVDGVFPEYVAGARKSIPAEEFADWEAGVRGALRPDGAHRHHADLGPGPRLRDADPAGGRGAGSAEVRSR